MAETNMGLAFDGEFTVGKLHLRNTGEGINLRYEKVGDTEVPDGSGAKSGFGVNGELRIGALTLAISDAGDVLRLRRENVGHQTETDAEVFVDLIDSVFFHGHKDGEPAEREVPEAEIEGVLEDAFFTRRIEKNGAVKTNLAEVRKHKA